MLTIVRFYGLDDNARRAVEQLIEQDFRRDVIHALYVTTGDDPSLLQQLVSGGVLPIEYLRRCEQAFSQGQAIVIVDPPFGTGKLASSILDAHDPVYAELPEVHRHSPAPLSDFLGIPLLSKGTTTRVTLSDNPAPLSSRFGWSLLSDNGTPLSSRFGWPLLKQRKDNWTRSFGLPLLTRRKDNWRSSFGFPLLSRNPTPLSSLLGLNTLSNPNTDRDMFGFPLLSNNPTPLSSALGLPVLTDEAFNKRDEE